jgi:hypothetical protein
MAQIVNEVIELGATFDNHRIRKCTIDDRTHVSIIDVVDALSASAGKDAWRAIKLQHPDLKDVIRNSGFPAEDPSKPMLLTVM